MNVEYLCGKDASGRLVALLRCGLRPSASATCVVRGSDVPPMTNLTRLAQLLLILY
jgi:hypothetical protein